MTQERNTCTRIMPTLKYLCDSPVLVYKTCEIQWTVLRLFSCLPPLHWTPKPNSIFSTLLSSAYPSPTSCVTLLGHFSFLLPFIPVLLLHLSHACVALRLLGLASSFLIAPVLLFAWHWLISWPWLVPSTTTSSISLAWLVLTHY